MTKAVDLRVGSLLLLWAGGLPGYVLTRYCTSLRVAIVPFLG